MTEDLHEEIEKLSASGTSLDRSTMDNLFQTIIQRLERVQKKGGFFFFFWNKETWRKQRIFGALLARLRMFDVQHFDRLMGKMASILPLSQDRPDVTVTYPSLVSAGCLTLPLILSTHSIRESASNSSKERGQPPPIFATGAPAVHLTYQKRAMREILVLFTEPVSASSRLITDGECYRFSILQDPAAENIPKSCLP